MLTCHLYIFCSEVFVQVFGPFLNRLFLFSLLSFKCSLYILDSGPLSELSFANIFSWLVACLPILLTVTFTEQRFLTLMRYRLSTISVINRIFDIVSKKSSLYPKSGEGDGTPLRYSCWKIPWMEEPGRLQSMGSLRVGLDWATSLSLFTFMHWRRKWQPTPVFLPGESQG